jgi:hypothetical protein
MSMANTSISDVAGLHSKTPLRRRLWSSSTRRSVIGAIVAASCAAVLGLAAWLTPSPTGLGTHEQLHLPLCGWIAFADMPCPTCGMTTAFAHAAHGNLADSFLTQPMGCLLALGTAITLLVSLHVMFTGSRLGWAFRKLWCQHTAWALAFMTLAAWAYKVLSYKGMLS